MSDTNLQWFRIAEVNADGTETISPMKAWLRKHPDHYPYDPSDKHSRTIERWLKQAGWRSKETPAAPGTPGEVLLYPPESLAPEAPSEDKAPIADESEYGSFRLEAELRDFWPTISIWSK